MSFREEEPNWCNVSFFKSLGFLSTAFLRTGFFGSHLFHCLTPQLFHQKQPRVQQRPFFLAEVTLLLIVTCISCTLIIAPWRNIPEPSIRCFIRVDKNFGESTGIFFVETVISCCKVPVVQ